jgi:hypothetical protein
MQIRPQVDRRGIPGSHRCFRHFQARAAGTQKAPFGPQNRQTVSDLSSKWRVRLFKFKRSSIGELLLADVAQRAGHGLARPSRPASAFRGQPFAEGHEHERGNRPQQQREQKPVQPAAVLPLGQPCVDEGKVRALILGSAATKHMGQPTGMGIDVGKCNRSPLAGGLADSVAASTGLTSRRVPG